VVENVARAARLSALVSCVIEPALLISAGLSLALSSPGVRYADLDGSLDLVDDPSLGGFTLENGFLKATDVPGLGGNVEL
jgi:L-Ala-D/L-Glu epimerase